MHAKGSDGSTPLHQASWKGRAEVVKAVLKKGADVHTKNSDGWTPMHWACQEDHAEVAAMLREKGGVA